MKQILNQVLDSQSKDPVGLEKFPQENCLQVAIRMNHQQVLQNQKKDATSS